MMVLVAGGAGYIGSVTATALKQAGHTPIILDSLISGPAAYVRDRILYRGDAADRALLSRIVTEHPDLECTIQMAARVVIGESVAMPYAYYRDNVANSAPSTSASRSTHLWGVGEPGIPGHHDQVMLKTPVTAAV
jgi:UDP-glucose 4-epimerase